jgi:uncharacterized membrane protein
MIPVLARADQSASQPAPVASPWWEVIASNAEYIIEQNTISQHYRLLTKQRTKIAASFDMADLVPIFSLNSKE